MLFAALDLRNNLGEVGILKKHCRIILWACSFFFRYIDILAFGHIINDLNLLSVIAVASKEDIVALVLCFVQQRDGR